MTYEITETNGSEIRRTTYTGTLTGAKRRATAEQVYIDSRIAIATADAAVAYKQHGRWTNTDAA
jgi:hypothetical protein